MVPEQELLSVLVVILDEDMVSEKVTLKVPVLATEVELSAGETDETVGAVLSAVGSVSVVKPLDCL